MPAPFRKFHSMDSGGVSYDGSPTRLNHLNNDNNNDADNSKNSLGLSLSMVAEGEEGDLEISHRRGLNGRGEGTSEGGAGSLNRSLPSSVVEGGEMESQQPSSLPSSQQQSQQSPQSRHTSSISSSIQNTRNSSMNNSNCQPPG